MFQTGFNFSLNGLVYLFLNLSNLSAQVNLISIGKPPWFCVPWVFAPLRVSLTFDLHLPWTYTIVQLTRFFDLHLPWISSFLRHIRFFDLHLPLTSLFLLCTRFLCLTPPYDIFVSSRYTFLSTYSSIWRTPPFHIFTCSFDLLLSWTCTSLQYQLVLSTPFW